MSTIQEFENAPVGATATHRTGERVIKSLARGMGQSSWASEYMTWWKPRELEAEGFTLDPAPDPAPTTSQEALDLAWELAHPVEEGQTIPTNTEYLFDHGLGYNLQVALGPRRIGNLDAGRFRTLDPLPDPEPDWLKAPAVLAAMNECSWQKVWLPKPDGNWECTCCGVVRHWSKMADVVPLCPKETNK